MRHGHRGRLLPFEALDDDLLDIHLCDPFAVGGASLKDVKGSSRVLMTQNKKLFRSTRVEDVEILCHNETSALKVDGSSTRTFCVRRAGSISRLQTK